MRIGDNFLLLYLKIKVIFFSLPSNHVKRRHSMHKAPANVGFGKDQNMCSLIFYSYRETLPSK